MNPGPFAKAAELQPVCMELVEISHNCFQLKILGGFWSWSGPSQVSGESSHGSFPKTKAARGMVPAMELWIVETTG